MSHSIPVMFDCPDTDGWNMTVSRYTAAQELSHALQRRNMDRSHAVESWWFVEGQDKAVDGNDNLAGRVVFDDDPDDLTAVIAAMLVHAGSGSAVYHFTAQDLEAAAKRVVRMVKTVEGGVVVELTPKGAGR